jgi:hypothetical protein
VHQLLLLLNRDEFYNRYMVPGGAISWRPAVEESEVLGLRIHGSIKVLL